MLADSSSPPSPSPVAATVHAPAYHTRAMRASTSCVLGLLAALCAPATVGHTQTQAPQPTFRTGVSVVNVDVVVSDRGGQPVADLTQADFEILEDGKRQDIE